MYMPENLLSLLEQTQHLFALPAAGIPLPSDILNGIQVAQMVQAIDVPVLLLNVPIVAADSGSGSGSTIAGGDLEPEVGEPVAQLMAPAQEIAPPVGEIARQIDHEMLPVEASQDEILRKLVAEAVKKVVAMSLHESKNSVRLGDSVGASIPIASSFESPVRQPQAKKHNHMLSPASVRNRQLLLEAPRQEQPQERRA